MRIIRDNRLFRIPENLCRGTATIRAPRNDKRHLRWGGGASGQVQPPPQNLTRDPGRPASVGPEALGQRGAEEIATEPLQTDAIVRGDPDVGVEVEAIELGLPGAPGGDVTEIRLVAEAADAGAGTGAEGNAALDGRADDPGEDGRGLPTRAGDERAAARPVCGPWQEPASCPRRSVAARRER
jgi:hypothetical protein